MELARQLVCLDKSRSALCLILAQGVIFLSGYILRISSLCCALLGLHTKSMRPVAMLARLDLLVSNPLFKGYILRYATLLFFTKDFNDQQGQFHPFVRMSLA